MQVIQILPDLSVTAQITPEDVAAAADQGFKSIICNRPDGEGRDQPAQAQIEAAAQARGIAFRSIAFTAGKQTPQDVKDFAAALKEMPEPVLAYCRTGTRSAKIWAQGYAAEHSVNKTIEVAAAAGIDLSGDRAMLEASAKIARD